MSNTNTTTKLSTPQAAAVAMTIHLNRVSEHREGHGSDLYRLIEDILHHPDTRNDSVVDIHSAAGVTCDWYTDAWPSMELVAAIVQDIRS